MIDAPLFQIDVLASSWVLSRRPGIARNGDCVQRIQHVQPSSQSRR
jgi:hypothetical protein